MNTARTLIASSLFSVATLFAASGAVAQEVTPTGFERVTSVASRADVQADGGACCHVSPLQADGDVPPDG